MNSDAEEDLNHRQTLKAAVHFTVGRTCEEVGAELGLSFSKQVIATLSEVTVKQIETYTHDLEAFSKHARRKTINVDDVKLLVRRNSDMVDHIKQMAESLGKPGSKDRKKRKRKSNATGAGTSKDQDAEVTDATK